jgi:uncharacterized protein (TIGR00251 family)
MSAPPGGEDRAQLRIRVQPKAASNRVVFDDAGGIRVAVTAPPSDGEANRAVCAVVAKQLGLAKSNVTVERGQRSRDKVIQINGLGEHEVLRRLSAR